MIRELLSDTDVGLVNLGGKDSEWVNNFSSVIVIGFSSPDVFLGLFGVNNIEDVLLLVVFLSSSGFKSERPSSSDVVLSGDDSFS